MGDDAVMQSRRHSGRIGWWMGASAALLAAFLGFVALILFLAGPGRASAGEWASVLGLLLAYMVAAVSVVLWAVRQTRTVSGGDPHEAAAGLRRAVRLQWTAEVGARQLEQPRPLRLRWRPTVRPVAVTVSGPGGSGPQLAGELVQDPADARSTAVALVEAFAGQPQRQLVVLGEPGAGKTTLVLLYVLAAIDAAGPDDPVPVLLSVAGWNPRERIEDWVVRRLAEDYPQVASRGGEVAWRLVQDQQVVPVLDGLDEMPRGLLGEALQELDRAVGSGMRMLLTCRSDEFEAAVAEVGALSRAAVVEIEAVPADDVAVYLAQREVAGTQRWVPVVQTMRQHPDGPLATALSTPLMISLARRVYRAPGTSPSELAELPTAPAVQDHLLGRFLPTVYSTPRAAARAEQWLAFLAHHLRERLRDPNLKWWHLAQAVPRLVITTLVAVTLTCLGALYGLAMGAVLILAQGGLLLPDQQATLTGAVVGWALGVLAGLHAGRAAHPPPQVDGRSAPGAVGGVLGDLGVVVAMLCVLLAATALLLLATYLVTPPAAVAFAIQLRTTTNTWFWMIVLLVIGTVTITNALGAGRTSAPRQSVPRGRDALPSLAAGLGIGLLFGLPATGIGWLLDLSPADVLGTSLMIAAVTSVPVTVGRWLGAPAEEHTASSPQSVLRGDRTALLLAAGAVAACTFAASVMISWRLLEGLPLSASLFVGALLGSAAAVVVLFGSGAPWLAYTAARLWLALRGRLPWRLSRFLRRAHTAGVLRQAGPAYQIRHDLLSRYLADRYRPTARRHLPAATEPRRAAPGRWLWRTGGSVVALMLLPTTVALVEPDTPPRITLPFTDLGFDDKLAFGTDGTTLTAVSFGADDPLSAVSDFWTLARWRLPGGTRTMHLAGRTTGSSAVSNVGTLVTEITDSSPGNLETEQVMLYNPDLRNRSLCGRTDLCSPQDVCGPDFHSSVTDVSISADDSTVVTGSDRGSVQLWSVATGSDPITITCGGVGSVLKTAVSPKGTKVVAIFEDGAVRMWDRATGAITTLDGAMGGYLSDTVFSANGAVLATASDDAVRMWRVADGAPLPPITTDNLYGLAITPGGSTVATYHWDGIVRLWNVATGRHTATLPNRGAHITAAAFSPDGNTLATRGQSVVQLWNVPELIAAQR